MPVQDFVREQQWLLPPSLSDLLPDDHAVRFVAAFVDAIPTERWHAMGINPAGVQLGRASYSVRAILGIWVYGFLVGIRSNRKLETACREQIPFLWLTGLATPDHNTLWGFYDKHRTGMRLLLRQTIKVAVHAGLVELAVHAVDGTKIWGNASRDHFRSRTKLEELLAQADEAIADLEAQNVTSAAGLPSLTKELTSQQKLRERVVAALAVLPAADPPLDGDSPADGAAASPTSTEPGTNAKAKRKAKTGTSDRGPRASLTDPDVRVMKGRHNQFDLGYNAIASVTPLVVDAAGRQGTLALAGVVSNDAGDVHQLVPILEAVEEAFGLRPETLADSGFHSAANLAACEARKQVILMPDPKAAKPDDHYAKERFRYDEATDTYRCPEGQTLERVAGQVVRPGERPAIRYRAKRRVCQACPVLALCQKGVPGQQAHGRSITFTEEETRLREHRELMEQEASQARYPRRKEWVEPKFGNIKTEQDGDHFLLRGVENVTDEWHLLLTSSNLKTLWMRWRTRPPAERWLVQIPAAA